MKMPPVETYTLRHLLQLSMSYTLYAVRVFSFKWQESFNFYKDVGGFPVSYVDESIGWAQFDLGGPSIGLERCNPEDPESIYLVGRFVGTSIAVDDIEAVYASLTAKGVPFVGPPEKQPWGGTLAHFKDPDGNTITLLGGTHA